MKKEGQEYPDPDEIEIRVVQEKKALLADISEKERVASDISECSDDKTEQNNTHSESTLSRETGLVVPKQRNRKKLARLDFSGA